MADDTKQILVVEDDSFLKDMLAQRLSQHSYEVLYASDGEEAINTIQDTVPDLVLLDLLLPGTGGFEVLKEIRNNEPTAEIPVVILSNLGQQEDINKGKQLGATDFLIKSNHGLDEIVDKIKEYLQQS
jgi:DNA-binding response OmpR family regulator